MKKYIVLAFGICIAFTFTSRAQNSMSSSSNSDTSGVIQPPTPRSSPMAIAFYKKDDLYLKAVYGQPNRKGRHIFGGLVPFGKIWRTGANEATELTTTKDIKLAGKVLKSGTYTLFTIPDKDKWTIIINSDLGQWGEYKYDAAKNLLSVDVVPQQSQKEVYEAFTIKFDENVNGADLVLHWDDTKVSIPVTIGNVQVSTGNTKKKKK